MPNTRDHAIVVGINDYRPLPALSGAINDARSFQRWLRDPQGGDVPEKNVRFIASAPNAPGTEPTQQQVEEAMLVHILNYRKNKERQRRLYLFMSGHGIVTDIDDIEGCRILMADAAASIDAITRNIGVQTAGTILQRTPIFEEIVLFGDSCREFEVMPSARNRLVIARAVEDLVKEAVGLDVQMMWGFATRWGLLVHETELPACDGSDQLCTRGRFTYALVLGLRRAVDVAGNVTRTSLEKHVVELMRRLTDAQSPEFGGSDKIVLARPSPIPETRVVVAPRAKIASFEIRGDGGFRAVPCPEDAIRVELSLPWGRYIFAVPGGGPEKPVTVLGEEVYVEL